MRWIDLWPLGLVKLKGATSRHSFKAAREKYSNGTNEYGEYCLEAMKQARPKLASIFQQCEKEL